MFRILYMSLFLAPFILFAQKPTPNFTCQHLKSNQQGWSKSLSDSRSDSIDIEHIAINLDVSNFAAKELDGHATLSIKAKVNNISTVAFDLLQLTVDSVLQNGQPLMYAYNDTLLRVQLTNSINTGETTDVTVFYQGPPTQNSGDWGGFYWNNVYAYNVGVSFLEDPHNYGRVWFPCFDNFVERSTYSFHITTDATRKAFCNGLLQNELLNTDGTVSWFWEMNQSIPSYLASVAVADYATVYGEYNGVGGAPIPIELAARPSDTTALKNSFINLNNALIAYESSFGPYHFDRVGYCVTSFNAGAMEHATNITYMRAAVTGNTLYETLMAHELSHHWWGDLVTCSNAEDMWLNEGWASYSEALFTEFVYGETAYKEFMRNLHDDNLRTLHINDGGYYPVSGVPTELTYSGTVYDKGSDMAHTIRGVLGDAVFFSCIQDFLEANKFDAISSSDFESYLSNCSGIDLSSFFDTWIFAPGHHHFAFSELTVEDQGDGHFFVNGAIKQKLVATNEMTDLIPLPITIYNQQWQRENHTVMVYGECSEFQLDLNYEPAYIALDLDEKISDATVDEYQVLHQSGLYDFDLGRAEVAIDAIQDSVLMRVVLHFVSPDPMQQPINGLHLSPNRFYTIEGIAPEDFTFDFTFAFNATTNQAIGFLDNDFIDNSEDSLVVMYKAAPADDWQIVDSFALNSMGSVNNGVGEMVVFNAQLGDYVLAIYDKNRMPDTSSFQSCIYTSINELVLLDKLVKVYPNPTKDNFVIAITDSDVPIDKLSVYNILGNRMLHQSLTSKNNRIEVDTQNWEKGTYIISLENKSKQIISKKIVIK